LYLWNENNRAILSSCESEGGVESDFNAERYHFEVKEMLCSYKDCDINEGDCSYISINYPQFTHQEGDEVLSKITESIDRIILGDTDNGCYYIGKSGELGVEEAYSVYWFVVNQLFRVGFFHSNYTLNDNFSN